MAAIVVDGLVKSFGSVRALDGVSLEVEPGNVLGLLGPNGSGKTTTVSVLSTLTRPDSGSAVVAGHDVVRDPAAVREAISLTGQYASLDEALTAAENIAMFGRLTGLRGRTVRDRVRELTRIYELTEVVDRKVSALSGGMRRRVDIACALVTRPQVLFLDEPTTGLDPRSRQSVWDTVSAMRGEGITVLLTTQYLEEADRLSDDIVMLDRGSVVAQGSAESLKLQAGGAVCEVTLVGGDHLASALNALSGMDLSTETSTGPSATDVHPRIGVRAPEGMSTVAEVIARLKRVDVEVFDIGLRRPSLDEVFLQLTGHRAASDGESRVDTRTAAGSAVASASSVDTR